MNTHNNELIELFKREIKLRMWLYNYYPIPEAIITKHKSKIWWKALSSNKNINWTPEFIKRNEDSFDWIDTMWKNPSLPISIEFITNNKGKFNLSELSNNTGTHWDYDFINEYKQEWNWHHLVINKSIQWTEKMFVDFDLFKHNLSYVNGPDLWTKEFILKYKDKFNWSHLCFNPHLPWSEELIDKLKPVWKSFETKTTKWTVSPWKGISENKAIPWSVNFIKKNLPVPIVKPYGLNWVGLSRNESLPWKNNIIGEFKNKWDWDLISINNGVGLTCEQIEKYNDKLRWQATKLNTNTIADNTSLPWSEELIDKYFEKWHWESLALNKGINWTDNMIKKYKGQIDYYHLFRNPSLLWSLDFILKYEKQCHHSWQLHTEDFSYVIWEKAFAKLLTDELVDEIISN